MRDKKQASFLSHLFAILLLPFNVILVIPSLLIYFFGYNIGWGFEGFMSGLIVVLGVLIAVCGLLLLAVTIKLFAARGKGTLAPWDPPRKLVVDGPYRYTRNPMISAVILVLFGEMLILGSTAILLWFVYFALINVLYIKFREEHGLERTFGEDYLEYKQRVPRLLPGKTFWRDKFGTG